MRRRLLRTAHQRSRGNTSEDCEDIVQEVLCNYIERCRVKEITDPFRYLYVSVINRLKDMWRLPYQTIPLGDNFSWWDNDTDDRLDDAMDIERIKAAGGEPLLEYYEWWNKPTPTDRVWAFRLRQKVRAQCVS